MTLKELTDLCTTLLQKVLDLENVKTAQAKKIASLKKRITKLEQRQSLRFLSFHPFRAGASKRNSLGRRKVSKQGRKNLKSQQMFQDNVLDEDVDTEIIIKDKGNGEKEMKNQKAKEKGIAFKDVDDSARPIRSITTLQPLLTIDLKDKSKGILQESEPVKKTKKKDQDQIERDIEIDVDHELVIRLTLEEQEKYTVEERSKLLAEFFERMKKQLAKERSEAIRSKPPTKTQFRNLMMTYLKHTGSEEDKKRIGSRKKRVACSSSKHKSPKKQKINDQDSEDSDKEHRKCLKVVPDDDKAIDYETLDVKSPIVDYESQGDLKTLVESSEDDEIWRNQQDWKLLSWKLYKTCGVHTLMLNDSSVSINMFVEKTYPLTKEILEKMLSSRLEAETKTSRPDITFVVCACARDLPFNLEAYSDSDYARVSLDKKSTTGEYVAATSCCRHVLWIQNQMLDYGFNLMNTKIYIDNKSTICVVKILIFHSKTMHIEIRHHFIRDSYEKKLIQTTAKVKKVNGQEQIQSLVDKKKVIIIEESIRRDLQFDDAESTACLPNDTIFEELAKIGAKTTAWNEFSNIMASAIICLANNQKFNFSKYIFDNMVKHLKGGVKFLMFLRFLQVFLDKQVKGMAKHKEIYVISSHTKKVFANMRRQGLHTDSHHTPTDTQPSLSKLQKKIKPKRKQRQATEVHSPSSEIPVLDLEEANTAQAKEIANLNKRVKKLENRRKSRAAGLRRLKKVGSKIALVDEAQGRMHDADMIGVDELEGNKVFVDVREKIIENEVSTADPVTTAGEVVIAANVEDSVAPTIATTANVDDELTLENTLIVIKVAKPKVISTAITTPRAKGILFHEQVQAYIPTVSSSKDKGKAKMIEPEKPLKKKDQITLVEEVARSLEAEIKAEMEEEERIAREKEKANRVVIEEWDDVQATIDADRRKYFAAKRAEEIKNKPPIKKIFDKVYNRVNTFVDMDTENVEESLKKTQAERSSKRAGQELELESTKKQKLAEQEQAKVANDDTAELKRCLEIVSEDDDTVAIEATPVSSKSPIIVDYKIYREGKKSYFKIIRADGNSQNYLTFGTMFKNFNREDLEVLRSIVKKRFKKTKPVDDMDNLLFQTLKTMFDPHVEDIIWKYQQGVVKVNYWKHFDSCGVYCVTTKTMVYYLLVEKMYPCTNSTLHQLWSDVRLQVDYEMEMAYDLLRLIRRQINKGYKPE
uniref:Uncharacterized protein n=1 Tax=Tanacetum cinerariifolium TaxID=118510 RepID=A0A6L2K6V5_TANCI|nr:hypothetical protein [Tanacetum cinerariifolium]